MSVAGVFGVPPFEDEINHIEQLIITEYDTIKGIYFDKSMDRWFDLPGNVRKTSGGKDFYFDFNKTDSGNNYIIYFI